MKRLMKVKEKKKKRTNSVSNRREGGLGIIYKWWDEGNKISMLQLNENEMKDKEKRIRE